MRHTCFASVLLLAALSASAGERFWYVYSRGEPHGTISKGSLDDILALKKRFTGTYLWVRVDGRDYIIRDAGVLAEIERLGKPMRALEAEFRELHRKMKPHERREDKLEGEIDAITDNDDDEKMTGAMRDRLRDLENQLRDVERELQQYEREEAKLERRESEVERVFDAEVERIAGRAIRNGVAERLR